MELELHQLDRRYEGLRVCSPDRDRRVLSSLSRIGQQIPIAVVGDGQREARYILIDGFARVRALERLRQDVVQATCWDLPESEALLADRLTRGHEHDSAIEQGWLLCELRDRFSLSLDELAQRFDRSPSWVSRRVGLVTELPDAIQEQVRRGRIKPHAAMKSLLPLARAKRDGAIALAEAIGGLKLTTRQTQALCAAFARGSQKSRQLLLERPEVFLRAQQKDTLPSKLPDDAFGLLCKDLRALAALADKAHARLLEGAARGLIKPDLEELDRHVTRTRTAVERLLNRTEKETSDAG